MNSKAVAVISFFVSTVQKGWEIPKISSEICSKFVRNIVNCSSHITLCQKRASRIEEFLFFARQRTLGPIQSKNKKLVIFTEISPVNTCLLWLIELTSCVRRALSPMLPEFILYRNQLKGTIMWLVGKNIFIINQGSRWEFESMGAWNDFSK